MTAADCVVILFAIAFMLLCVYVWNDLTRVAKLNQTGVDEREKRCAAMYKLLHGLERFELEDDPDDINWPEIQRVLRAEEALTAKQPPASTEECAMCGSDIRVSSVTGHNNNKFCRYCYYPTAKEAAAKGKPGWSPDKAGERYGG